MDKIKASQKKIGVTFNKKFIYPSAVLDSDEGAYGFAKTDLLEMIKDIVIQEEIDLSKYFDIEVREEPLFKFRKELKYVEKDIKLGLGNCTKKIVTYLIETKYSQSLDPNKNKDSKLFVYDPPILADDKKTVIHEGEWFLHPDIEKEYQNLHNIIYTLLKK